MESILLTLDVYLMVLLGYVVIKVERSGKPDKLGLFMYSETKKNNNS